MTQQHPAPIRGDVKQVCFPLLDAHVAKLEDAARKHGPPRALFVQWLVSEYLRSVEDGAALLGGQNTQGETNGRP